MPSYRQSLPFCLFLAAALEAAAAVGGLSGGVGPASHADGPQEEKGRPVSEILAEQRQYRAIAEQLEARRAEALEARRRAVSVPSDADECLAFHRVERRCLVTVGAFNRRLADDAQWLEGGGDSVLQTDRILDIRNRLLATLLEDRFADALVDGGGAGLQAEDAWRDHLAGIAAAAGNGTLRDLYRRHAATFGPRREVQAEFLGASDSSFLDSLVRCMLATAPAGADREAGPAGKGCASGRRFLWGKLRPGDLADDLPRVTGALRQGEISEIVRGRFGWYVIAAARVVEIPAKTYEESRPLLAFMAGLKAPPGGPGDGKEKPPAVPGPGRPAAASAGGEDPALRVWLLPRTAPAKGRGPAQPAWSDTTLAAPLRLRLSALPDGVACEAAAQLRRSGRGMAKSRYGTWYFLAEEKLSAVQHGKEDACDPETGTPGPAPDLFTMASEELASKEKSFKLNFLETQPRAPEAAGSGAASSREVRTRWIAENVILEKSTLMRF
jgi:hypothetical protein